MKLIFILIYLFNYFTNSIIMFNLKTRKQKEKERIRIKDEGCVTNFKERESIYIYIILLLCTKTKVDRLKKKIFKEAHSFFNHVLLSYFI
jgi:hypothetical protein